MNKTLITTVFSLWCRTMVARASDLYVGATNDDTSYGGTTLDILGLTLAPNARSILR